MSHSNSAASSQRRVGVAQMPNSRVALVQGVKGRVPLAPSPSHTVVRDLRPAPCLSTGTSFRFGWRPGLGTTGHGSRSPSLPGVPQSPKGWWSPPGRRAGSWQPPATGPAQPSRPCPGPHPARPRSPDAEPRRATRSWVRSRWLQRTAGRSHRRVAAPSCGQFRCRFRRPTSRRRHRSVRHHAQHRPVSRSGGSRRPCLRRGSSHRPGNGRARHRRARRELRRGRTSPRHAPGPPPPRRPSTTNEP